MAISTTLSTAVVTIGSAGAVSDGSLAATLVVTVYDTAGNVLPNCQVHVRAMDSVGSMIVQHEHVNAFDLDRRISYTDGAGRATIPLGSISSNNVSVRYIVYVGEDAPDTILYTENADFLAGFRNKPDGSGYIVGTITTIPFARTFATAQTIDDAWIIANNTFGGVTSRIIRNTVFADTTTLAFTVDPSNAVRFSNCVFATSAGNYALVTQGREFTATNCGVRGSQLAGVYGEGGTFVRSVFDSLGRDAFQVEQGSTFTPTRFFQCRFRRLGRVTAGYAFRGTPMRNVVADHCWFELGATEVLAPVSQTTTVGGARGPVLVGCWIEGGSQAQVSSQTGASNSVPEFLRVRACRFARGSASTYIDSDCLFVAQFVQGNMDDATGRLIDNATYPGVNTTAGPVEMFEQVTLAAMPSIDWIGASTGGGGGGPGTGEPPGTSPGANLDTDLLYSVTERLADPVGGGPGGRVVRPNRLSDTPAAAVPILYGGVVTPPVQPATVNWDETTSAIFEGSTRILTARLTPSAGNGLDPAGYSVPVTATYAGGAASTEFTLPEFVVFGPGASIAQYTVQSIEDMAVEGDETLTLTLGAVSGFDPFGNPILTVVPGSNAAHVMTVMDNDTGVVPVNVSFGIHAVPVLEPIGDPSLPPTSQLAQVVNVPISLSGNPSGPVIVRVTATGTATIGTDYTIEAVFGAPVQGTTNVWQWTIPPNAGGSTGPVPFDRTVRVIVYGDGVYETPDDTVILTLTSQDAATGTIVGGPCTVTIEEQQDPPATAPVVGWRAPTAIALLEANGNYAASLGSATPNNAFSAALTQVRVQVVEQTATLEDFDLVFSGGYEASGSVGLVNFFSGDRFQTVTIQPENDLQPEPTPETFVLRILDHPTGAYTVDAANQDLEVTLLDPLGGGTNVFVERIAGLSASIVSCTVPVRDGVADTTTGWNMSIEGAAAASNCQWYPVAYKPDGTPDAVHIFGYLDGAARSLPGAASAIVINGGATVDPSPPVDMDTQLTEVLSNDLTLTLLHNVNGETREFVLPITTTGSVVIEQLVGRNNANLQGGGPDLMRRWRAKQQLFVDSPLATDPSDDRCTVARVYLDQRADVNAVRVAVNWGNYRWRRPSVVGGAKVANAYVDGEVFFDSLHLNGVPDGWAAVVLDPRSSVSDFVGGDVGTNHVRIIRGLAAGARNYVPPLRGHMAYIVLYKAAEVTSTQATAILNGWDIGYSVGPLGVTYSDALGEVGVPLMNYGTGSPPFFDREPNGTSQRFGWDASEQYNTRQLSGASGIETRITAGLSDITAQAVARGYWCPLGDPDAGSPGGNRIDLTAGSYPGKNKRRKNMLEHVHLMQRVGMTPWTERGEDVTDEDFCVNFRTTTAMWTGIGAQRMAHQHFMVPDFLSMTQVATGVAEEVKLGPGRKRAKGSITLVHPLQDGDAVTVTSHTGTTRIFTFYLSPPAVALPDVAVVRHPTDNAVTNENLFRALFAQINPTTFPIHPRYANDGTTFSLRYRFHGTVGNGATISTTSGPRIVVTDIAGGLDTNAVGGVRLWNYLTYGSNTSSQDTYNDWHARHVTEDTLITGLVSDQSYHCWDWPHMSRMNEVTRDGWWLYFDPLAHDTITGLMHLATMCFSRYPEARETESPFVSNGANPATQLGAATAYSNLALIREGHNGQYLREYIARGFAAQYPATTFTAQVGSGLNCGTWATRNPHAATMALGSSGNYLLAGDWVIDRGWGWAMATVARGYAISAAHRATLNKDAARLVLHPGNGIPASGRVSWFEMMREVIKLTMHVSGAPSSADSNAGNPNPYDPSSQGAIDFTNRRGAIPGGELNTPPGGPGAAGDDEWYPNVIAWHSNYVALGAYAILRRVYSWVDRDNQPSTLNNPWLTDLGALWRLGLRLFQYAKAVQGGAHFFVPTFSLASVGDSTTGQSIYGRFNSQTGTANPALTANFGRMFWWSYNFPIPAPGGVHPSNFYAKQYLLWSWMLWRIDRSAEVVNTHPGLVGQGEGVIADRAVAVAQTLKTEWEFARLQAFSAENVADQSAWAIQWHRNEFVPLTTSPFP